jgi:hypothetical protein
LEAKGELDAAEQSKLDGAKAKIAEIEKEQTDFQKKEEELESYTKAHPKWNVDNMSSDKHNRTLINSGWSLVFLEMNPAFSARLLPLRGHVERPR